MVKISLSAFFVLACLAAGAQNKDRVITNNNDTIPCIISQSALTAAFKYRTTDDGRKIKITPDKIKEFYKSDKAYWYRRISRNNGKPMFMAVVEQGKICLYEATIYYGSGKTVSETKQWYASKGSDTAIMVKNMGDIIFSGRIKRKDEFGGLLADNKVVYDKYIADGSFSVDEIKKVVQLYNGKN